MYFKRQTIKCNDQSKHIPRWAGLKGLGLIKKLVLKVAFWHVLNHDISHWPDMCILRVFFYFKFFFSLAKWAKRGPAIGQIGAPTGKIVAPNGQRGALPIGKEGPRTGLREKVG